MTRTPLRFLALYALATLAALGCGTGGKKDALVPVKGTVTINGKGLSGGQIAFHPASGQGPSVTGLINADGTYEANAPAGEYKVAVDNSTLKTSAAMPGAGSAEMPGMANAAKYVPINAKYAKPDTSGLTTKVEGSSHSYSVDLK